jgi:hypothetical protein
MLKKTTCFFAGGNHYRSVVYGVLSSFGLAPPLMGAISNRETLPRTPPPRLPFLPRICTVGIFVSLYLKVPFPL